MGIFEEMIAEHLAIKAEKEALAAERNYLSKMIELIEKVIACKEAGLSFEALDQAGMYLSEQAFRMEQEVGNEKILPIDASFEEVREAYEEQKFEEVLAAAEVKIDEAAEREANWDTSRGELCLEDHPRLGLIGINHAHKRKEV